jgi:predicted nucleic acid-binding Zn ribbon protein
VILPQKNILARLMEYWGCDNENSKNKNTMTDRKCLECAEQLRGRTDQKFCSDQCRSAYNNKQYVETNTVIRMINRILKKNYSILNSLTAEGKTTATMNDLQKKGYRFDYFTYTSTARNNKVNNFCYDLGYREQDNNKIVLVRQDLNSELSC